MNYLVYVKIKVVPEMGELVDVFVPISPDRLYEGTICVHIENWLNDKYPNWEAYTVSEDIADIVFG